MSDTYLTSLLQNTEFQLLLQNETKQGMVFFYKHSKQHISVYWHNHILGSGYLGEIVNELWHYSRKYMAHRFVLSLTGVICGFVGFVKVLRGRALVVQQQPQEDCSCFCSGSIIIIHLFLQTLKDAFNELITQELVSVPTLCYISHYLMYPPFATCYLLFSSPLLSILITPSAFSHCAAFPHSVSWKEKRDRLYFQGLCEGEGTGNRRRGASELLSELQHVAVPGVRQAGQASGRAKH